MPRIGLTAHAPYSAIPVEESTGARLLRPRLQFLCWVRLPNMTMPRDGVIDTGAPFTWFAEGIWSRLQPGIDFEELPFEVGYAPPRVQTAGWTFTFRMARLLQPLVLFDTTTELERNGVIVQLANGNPPTSAPNRPARLVLGLWGGVLEGTNLRISTDPGTGHAVGALEW